MLQNNSFQTWQNKRKIAVCFLFQVFFASCSTSERSMTTYNLCSDCAADYSSLEVFLEAGSATLTDEAENAVSLTNSTITATQTINEVEEYTCYDTYPGYSFESLLTFSFEEEGGETTTVALTIVLGSGGIGYDGSIQINGNDIDDATSAPISSSYDIRINAEYTNQGGQSRVLSIGAKY